MVKSPMPFIPKVDDDLISCFFFPSRTGILFFGWSGFIGSVLMASPYIYPLLLPSSSSLFDRYEISEEDDIFQGCLTLILAIILAVIHFLLIRGIYEVKPTLMYPWIYLAWMGVILFTLCAIIFTINQSFESTVIAAITNLTEMGTSSAPILCITISVTAYCQKLLADQGSHHVKMTKNH